MLISPFIIFYAIGRVPDISTFSFVKTGGIFVKSKTTNLSVSLNNEFQKETSFFSGGALLTNIKTGRYILKIEKAGHKPWYKSVDVLPERVTELRNILILPGKNDIEQVKELNGDLLSLSPDSNWLLLEKKQKSLKNIYIFNTQTQKSYPVSQINPALDRGTLNSAARIDFNVAVTPHQDSEAFRGGVNKNPISSVIWGDSQIILNKGNAFSFIKEAGNVYIEESMNSLFKSKVIIADFYSTSRDSFVALDSNHRLSIFKNGAIKKIRDNVNSFGVYESDIFFVDQNGFLAKLNIETNEVKIINRPGFFLSDNPAQINFSPNGDLFLIDSSGGLFFVSLKEENIIHTVAGEVRGAEFDSLGEKLLFWTPNEIKIFWIEPNIYQPFQNKFTIEPIFRIDSGLKEARWFTKDDFHVIIGSDNGIYITEIDGRGGRNTIELVNKKTGGIFWDNNLNKLYFSSSDGVETISL